MILSSLLMLLASVPGPQVSPLVFEKKGHDWVKVLDTSEGLAWYDRKWKSSRVVEGQTFPVYLLRMQLADPTMPAIADIAMVVDCKGDRMGMAQLWTDGVPDYPVETFETVDMDFSEDPSHPDDMRLFRAFCGADWQP